MKMVYDCADIKTIILSTAWIDLYADMTNKSPRN